MNFRRKENEGKKKLKSKKYLFETCAILFYSNLSLEQKSENKKLKKNAKERIKVKL